MSCWFSHQRSERIENEMFCRKDLFSSIILFTTVSSLLLMGTVFALNTDLFETALNDSLTLNITMDDPIASGIDVAASISDGSIFAVYLKVENYTLPIEDRIFKLYEVYPDRVVLKDYFSFYFDEKEFSFGTNIQYKSNNETLSHIIGHHKNYYPITNRKSRMYCGLYWMEYVGRCRDLFYQNKRFRCMEDLHRTLDLSMFNESCFIYIYDDN